MTLWRLSKRWFLVIFILTLIVFLYFLSSNEKYSENNIINLTLWHGLESEQSSRFLEEKISLFQASHPNVRISPYHYGPADELTEKIMTSIAASQPPDFLWWGPHATGFLARSGALLNLTPLIEQDATFDPSHIYTKLWDLCSFENKKYAVPFEVNNLGLYYNVDHFKEAGIDPASLNTWDGFMQAAGRLTIDKDQDGLIDRYGFQIPLGHKEWTVWVWQTFLWQAGGEFLNKDNTQTAFNSKAGRKALSFWLDLLYTHKAAYLSQPDAGFKLNDFVSGRVSMVINGPWNLKLLSRARAEKNLNYGVLPLPADKKAATNTGGENLFIFKTDPAEDKIKWELAKFFLSPEFQTDWAIQTGYLPVNQQVIEEQRYQDFLQTNPFIKVYNAQMSVGHTRPTIPSYPKISDILGRQLEKALYRKVTVEKALKTAAQEADKLLASGG